jgi:hypothetical protein
MRVCWGEAHVRLIILATIFLFPFALAGAALLLLVCRKLDLVPRNAIATSYLLLLCLLFGLFYLGTSVDTLVVRPARLQKEYLGERIAGPLALVRYEAGGFQDPYRIWDYRLTARQKDALAPRCQWQQIPNWHRICSLYSANDERSFASVTLDGDRLRLHEGLQ